MTMTPTNIDPIVPVRHRGLAAMDFFKTAPTLLSDALQEGYIPYSVIAALISFNRNYPDADITFNRLYRTMIELDFEPIDGSGQTIHDKQEFYRVLTELTDRYGNTTMTIEGLKDIGLQVNMTFYNDNGKMKYCGLSSLGHDRLPHKDNFNDDIKRCQGIVSPEAAYRHTLVITDTMVNELDINYMIFAGRMIK